MKHKTSLTRLAMPPIIRPRLGLIATRITNARRRTQLLCWLIGALLLLLGLLLPQPIYAQRQPRLDESIGQVAAQMRLDLDQASNMRQEKQNSPTLMLTPTANQPTIVANATAAILVNNTILAATPERIGAHVQIATNNFIADSGMEPQDLRFIYRATGFGNHGGGDYIATSNAGWWDTRSDHFFDGAGVRIYRYDAATHTVSKIREDRLTFFAASEDRLYLASTGAPVQANDMVMLDLTVDNPPSQYIHPRLSWAVNTQGYWEPVGGARISRDRTTVAPENGGLTSLRLTIPVTTTDSYLRTEGVFHYPNNGWYPSLTPGQTYRLEVWLKQSGIPNGQVRMSLGSTYNSVNTTFTVGDTWQKYTYDFTGPPYMSTNAPVAYFYIDFDGGGTLWIDNLDLYDRTYGVNQINPRQLQEYIAYHPGPTRNFGGWDLYGSLQSWTNLESQPHMSWDVNNGPQVGPQGLLPTLLPLAQQSGGTPWLVVNAAFREDEWLGLVEYLAGPAGTPYGDKRIAQRGNSRTWAEEFPKIRIEFANEAWNPLFGPQQWNDAGEYGALAEYFFQVAQRSPYWNALADKVEFVLNGWVISPDVNGYGARAKQSSPSGAIVDVTAYIGGWERGQTFSQVTEKDYADLLTFGVTDHLPYINRHVETQNTLAAQGYAYKLGLYEGGPGYSLPGPGLLFEAEELIGKSLAAGITTFDMYLYNTQRGFGPQNYFTFSSGNYWTSHSLWENGFNPHPAWQALRMRNRYASGDLITAQVVGGPGRDVRQVLGGSQTLVRNVPLLGSYAFRNNNSYTVFVFSRSLTETVTTTLRLPFSTAGTATLHKLTGDPRANNRYTVNITETHESLTGITDHYTFAMPPGSLYAFVFDNVTPLAQPARPSVTIAPAPGQATTTSERRIEFNLFFSEPVSDFTASDLQFIGSATVISWTVVPIAGSANTAWQLLATGFTSDGTVLPTLPENRVRDSDNNGNTASVASASVTFQSPPPAGLLAYEPFAYPVGVLHGNNGGSGWRGPWEVQAMPNNGETYDIRANSLAYFTLNNNGGHAGGGDTYLSTGRPLSMTATGPFAQYLNSSNLVGIPGTTVWLSALLRKTANNGDQFSVQLHDSSIAWLGQYLNSAGKLSVGYFGAASDSNGIRYWSVRVGTPDNTAGGVIVRSNIPLTINETAFVVLRIDFAPVSTLRLYVNPETLGSAPPVTPALTMTTTANLAFRAVSYYAGYNPDYSAIDEIRIGGTYASVAPAANPGPVIPPTPTPTGTPAPTNTATATPTAPQPPTATPSATLAPGRATIHINLDAQPDSIQNFRFTGDLGAFSLDDAQPDDGDALTSSRTLTKRAGSYVITQTTPSGWFLTAITCTPTAKAQVDLSNQRVTVTAAAGDTITCTFVAQRSASITARTFQDNNGDQRRQSTEPWLAGWTITAYYSPDSSAASGVTNPNGQFTFNRLRPGSYTICVALQTGWHNTVPGALQPPYHQPCYSVTLQPNQTATVTFGNQPELTTVGGAASDGGTNTIVMEHTAIETVSVAYNRDVASDEAGYDDSAPLDETGQPPVFSQFIFLPLIQQNSHAP